MTFRVKNLYFCQIIWENSSKSNKVNRADLILRKLKEEYTFTEHQEKRIRLKLVTSFLSQFNRKWQNASRTREAFKSKNAEFLKNDFVVENLELLIRNTHVAENDENSHTVIKTSAILKRGRPRLSFKEGSSKTKRRLALKTAAVCDESELSMALKIKQSMHVRQPEIELETVLFQSETKDKQLHNQWAANVAMYMDTCLSKERYEKMRIHNNEIVGSKLYPPYKIIAQAKKNCYPEHIETYNCGAKVHLISLIDHTVRQILLTLPDNVIKQIKNKSLTLLGKWGMDGASGQQNTRQSWYSDNDNDTNHLCYSSDSDVDNIDTDLSDKAVFLTTFVPLRLMSETSTLWINEKPNSVLKCRPIRFDFTKETKSLTIKNYNHYTKILEKVKNYVITFKDMTFHIKFDLKCTMIDGKVCNTLTNQNASNSCNICFVSPKNINKIDYVRALECKVQFYDLGFPVLHSWIRFMEYINHIAYNLNFKKGSAIGTIHQEMKKKRKKEIQDGLRQRLNLTIDVVKQGAGTTNTGNVAREYFAHAKIVSEVTGIDEGLVNRLYTVLQVISSKQQIDIEKFKEYCIQTAKKCVELYDWYNMPPSVHKVLIHGCDIMKHLGAPMGWFSEEPQEASNKIFRRARLNHSRMFQRTRTNEDIMHHLLVSSCPIVNSFRVPDKGTIKQLTPEAKQFLKNPKTIVSQKKREKGNITVNKCVRGHVNL